MKKHFFETTAIAKNVAALQTVIEVLYESIIHAQSGAHTDILKNYEVATSTVSVQLDL